VLDVRRREFITLLSGAAAYSLQARAQQPQMPVVGFLHAGTPSAFASLVTAFREGLGTAGYVEGRSVAIEYRWAENQYERLPALLTDLVSRRVAVIAALGDGPAATAKAGTSAIPVVVIAASDPVEAGLVGSLNRPGGNITGISMFTSDLMAKRIELLTELVTTTIGLLVNPTGRRAGADTNEAQAAARALGQQIEVLNAGSADEIDAAFITLVQRRVGALVTGTDVLFTTRYEQIAALANRYDIPTIFPWREFVTAGGLASYGITHAEPYRQVGGYVGRILKGEKVGDLPVQQPTKFELVINLKTAKALGLEVPTTLLARADEVIE
jgi:putative tryptophan/tyrosine transport system substrate-binding protein